MWINIHIDCNNAAFNDTPEIEVARILSTLAKRIQDSTLVPLDKYTLQDFNGNEVGQLKVFEDL